MKPKPPLIPNELIVLVSLAIIIGRLAFMMALAKRSYATFHMQDFGLFYEGLQAWRAGGSLYAPNAASYWLENLTLLDLAPPHLHLFIWPLTWLPVAVMFWVWFAMNTCALVASVFLALRELKIAATPVRVLPILAFVFATRSIHSLQLGQYDGLLALVVTLAWIAMRRERWRTGFAWLGLVVTIKPFPVLLLLLAAKARRLRDTVTMFAVAAAVVACGVAVFGVSSYREWVSALGSSSDALSWLPGSISATSMWTRLFTPSPQFAPLAVAPQLATWGAALSAIVILWVTWRATTAGAVDRSFAALWVAALLVSPIAWIHYPLVIVAPLLATAIADGWQRRPLAYALGAMLTLAGLMPLDWGRSPLTTLLGGSWTGWVTIGLWFVLVTGQRAQPE